MRAGPFIRRGIPLIAAAAAGVIAARRRGARPPVRLPSPPPAQPSEDHATTVITAVPNDPGPSASEADESRPRKRSEEASTEGRASVMDIFDDLLNPPDRER